MWVGQPYWGPAAKSVNNTTLGRVEVTMDHGHSQFLDLAYMRQAELLREAEHDRLVRSLTVEQPSLLSRLSRMFQGRQDGRSQSPARLSGQRRLAH